MKALIVFMLFVMVQIAVVALSRITSDFGLSLLILESALSLLLWFCLYRWKGVNLKLFRTAAADTEKVPAVDIAMAQTPDITEKRSGGSSKRPLHPGRTVLFAILGTTLTAFGLSLVLGPLHLPDEGTTIQFEGMLSNGLNWLLLVLIGPLCEELTFRAGIQQSLLENKLHPWLAAALSALAFALIHGNLAQGIPAFIVGFVLGLLYNRTGNLWLCLPAHIANNLLAVVLLAAGCNTDLTERWPVWAVVLLGVFHMGLGLRNLRRTFRQPLTNTTSGV